MDSERKDYNSLRVALFSVKAILACAPVFVLPFALKPIYLFMDSVSSESDLAEILPWEFS